MTYDPRAEGCLCDECPLEGRRVVPPEGPANAVFVIIGDAPQREEEIRQQPFIGPAGRLLDDMMDETMQVSRAQAWLTNLILCRPFTPVVTGRKKHDMATMLAWVRVRNKEIRQQAEKTGRDLKLYRSPIECCQPRLRRELAKVEANAQAANLPNGAVVLALGNFVSHALTGKLSIHKVRGSPVPVAIQADGSLHPKWDPRPEGV